MKKNAVLILIFIILFCSLSFESSYAEEPTGRCINSINEGIEYRIPIGLDFDADSLRRTMYVIVGDGTNGEIIGMEVEVANSRTLYQCTQVIPGLYEDYSCNSMPANAKVNAVHLLYVPNNVKEGETVRVQFRDSMRTVLTAYLTVRTPVPCSMGYLIKDFSAEDGEALIINTADCDGNGIPGPADPGSSEKHKYVDFREMPANFRIANISQWNTVSDVIDPTRLNIDVVRKETYSYNLRLYFSAWDELVKGEVDPSKKITDAVYWVDYRYNENRPYDPLITFSGSWYSDPVTQYKLPLTLVGGRLYNISTSRRTPAGDPDFPLQSDFYIRFWYENNTGSLGYENSVFHFERAMTVQFSPYCSRTAWTGEYFTGVVETPYEASRKEKQLFSIDLTDRTGLGIWIPDNQADCSLLPYCQDLYSVYVTDASIDPIPSKADKYYFAVRKCADSSCSYLDETNSYLYSITAADGDNLAVTYKSSSHSAGSTSVFPMKVYEKSGLRHPFMLMKVGFVAEEPGTYMVFGFLEPGDIKYNDLSHYAARFYLSVGRTGHYAAYDGGYVVSYASSAFPVSASASSVSGSEPAEEAAESGLRFAADKLELFVGQSLPLDIIDPDGTEYMVILSHDDTASYNKEENSVTGLAEGSLTAYLANVETVDIADSLWIRVRNDVSAAAADTETVEQDGTGESSDGDADGSTADEGSAETAETVTGPRFNDSELTLSVGEQVTLSVWNPEETEVLVGLSGDTDAVRWDETSLTVTGLSAGEVQAFLSTFDVVDVKDICRISIIPGPETETEPGPEEDIRTEETAEPDTGSVGQEEPFIIFTPTDETSEEETGTGPQPELTPEPEYRTVVEQTPEPTVTPEEEREDETAAEEVLYRPDIPEDPAVILPEVNIRDLTAEGLQGFAGEILNIERERFELPDEVFTRLNFSIENEWVACLTDRSADEMLARGIELNLLNAGETKLRIYFENETDPLREIRISAVLPVPEETPFVPEQLPVPTETPSFEPETYPAVPSDPTPAEEETQIPYEEPVYEFTPTSVPEEEIYWQDPDPVYEEPAEEQGPEYEYEGPADTDEPEYEYEGPGDAEEPEYGEPVDEEDADPDFEEDEEDDEDADRLYDGEEPDHYPESVPANLFPYLTDNEFMEGSEYAPAFEEEE